MAAVDVAIPNLPPIGVGRPKVTVSRPGGPVVTLPITSPEVEAGDLAADWAPLPRGGDALPLLGLRGRRLETRRLTAVVDEDALDVMVWGFAANQVAPGYPGRITPIVLDELARLAMPGPPVLVAYSDLTAGLWRITSLTWRTTKLAPTDNHPIRADVSIELTRASDPPPVTRTPAAPPPAPPPSTAPPPPADGARTYTVRADDTLWGIAAGTYGNGNLWRRIADANHIRDPRTLRPGQILTLP